MTLRGSFDEDLIELFHGELDYLRSAGADFARKYPKLASRLDLGGSESTDPHVERLLESFAFLTARLQNRIHAEFPEVPSALLRILYPHLCDPVPPLAIAHFAVSADAPPPPAGQVVPRLTSLYASADDRTFVRFRTAYDVDLRPVEITDVSIVPVAAFDFFDTSRVASVLRIRLTGVGEALPNVPLQKLRVHIAGDRRQAMDLHEMILSTVEQVYFASTDGEQRVRVTGEVVREVGFAEDEAVLNEHPYTHRAYGFLQEYFHFPEKFLFFDLLQLDRRPALDTVDILLGLNAPPRSRMELDETFLRLGCTPVVNLFPKTAEPIRIDHTRSRFLVVPELGGEMHYQVHSVLSVTISSPSQPEAVEVQPYFSFQHDFERNEPRVFWFAAPTAARGGLPGTDTYISFIEENFRPTRPAAETATVRTLCTNRVLAEQLPPRAALQADQDIPADIFLLTRPTPPITQPYDGRDLWRLVSQLSLNYLSLSNEQASLRALQEILTLYCPPHKPAADQEIRGIRSIRCRPIVRRIGTDAWRGFCSGTGITLEVDERNFVGGNPYMLASILNRFFALYAAINSFTELTLVSTQREGVWKKWPPIVGDKALM